MRNVLISSTDFELFDSDMTAQDYEFFQKHKGAFKSLLEDQSQEQKQKFVDAFQEFSVNHGCIKNFPVKNDNILALVDKAIQYLNESFVNGRFSKAKCLVTDAVCLAQNRPVMQYIGSSNHAKNPFIHKDSRDVFRRLFGEPIENETCLKVMCVLPLYIKFGGSICRYLKRWLEAGKLDELGVTSLTAIPLSALLKSKSTSNTGTDQGLANTPQSSVRVLTSEVSSSSNTMVAVATVGGRNSGSLNKANSSDEDNDDVDDDDDDDNWHTKVIRGIQSVLTDRAGPSPIEYMEVYKRDKDGSYRRLREDFHLGKPHPNQEFEERCRKKEEERIEGSRLHEVIMKDYSESQIQIKRHQCANCKKVEKERGMYKKCGRCKGKGTKFYCSRKCQEEDWVSRHREDHSVELPS